MTTRSTLLFVSGLLAACAAHPPAPTVAPVVETAAPVVAVADDVPPPPEGLTHLDAVVSGHCEEVARLALIADYTGYGPGLRDEAVHRIAARTAFEVASTEARRAAARACLEANVTRITRAVRDVEAYAHLFVLMRAAPAVMTTPRLLASLGDETSGPRRAACPLDLAQTLEPEVRHAFLARGLLPQAALGIDDVVAGRVRTPEIMRDALADAIVREDDLATIRAVAARLREADPDDLLGFIVTRGLEEATLDETTRRARVRDFVVLVTPAQGCTDNAAYARLFAADAAAALPWQRLAFAEVLRHAERGPDAERLLGTLANATDPEIVRMAALLTAVIAHESVPNRFTSSAYFNRRPALGPRPTLPPICHGLPLRDHTDLRDPPPTGDAVATLLFASGLSSRAAIACFTTITPTLSAVERQILALALPDEPGSLDLRTVARAAERVPHAFRPFAKVFLRAVLATETLPALDLHTFTTIAEISVRHVAETARARDRTPHAPVALGALARVLAIVAALGEGRVNDAGGHLEALAQTERDPRAVRELHELAALMYAHGGAQADANRVLAALAPSRLAPLVAALREGPRGRRALADATFALFPEQYEPAQTLVDPAARGTLARSIPPLGVGRAPMQCRSEGGRSALGRSDAAAELSAYLEGRPVTPNPANVATLGLLQRVFTDTPSASAFAIGDLELAEAYAEDDATREWAAALREDAASGVLAQADVMRLITAQAPEAALVIASRNPRSEAGRARFLALVVQAPRVSRALRTTALRLARVVIEEDDTLALDDAVAAVAAFGTRAQRENVCAEVEARYPDIEACAEDEEDDYDPSDDIPEEYR